MREPAVDLQMRSVWSKIRLLQILQEYSNFPGEDPVTMFSCCLFEAGAREEHGEGTTLSVTSSSTPQMISQ